MHDEVHGELCITRGTHVKRPAEPGESAMPDQRRPINWCKAHSSSLTYIDTKISFRSCAGNDARANRAAGIQAPLTRMVATPCYRAPEVCSFMPLSMALLPHQTLSSRPSPPLVGCPASRQTVQQRQNCCCFAGTATVVPVWVVTPAGCHTLRTHSPLLPCWRHLLCRPACDSLACASYLSQALQGTFVFTDLLP